MLPHDERGSGPAVLLLHAGIADRTMWSEHLEPLAAAGHRVVAVDLPGFGEAIVGEGEQAPWMDVLEAMDGLGIEDAALVGNSFGGAVALRVAVVAPARVSALALISSPAPDAAPSAELEAAWAAEEAAMARGDLDGAVDAVVSAWTLPDAPPALRERIAAMQRRAFVLQAQAGDVSEAPDPLEQNLHALGQLQMPTLVAWGAHDMSDFRDAAYVLSRSIPLARREVIEDAGHLAPLETPDAFRSLLLDFLRQTG